LKIRGPSYLRLGPRRETVRAANSVGRCDRDKLAKYQRFVIDRATATLPDKAAELAP